MTSRPLLMVLLSTVACGSGVFLTNASIASDAPAAIVQLNGSGATFPAPLYKKWIAEYQKDHLQVLLNYKPVGSGEGVKQFMAGAVDFGASDAAMSDEQMAGVARGVQLVPMTAGIIVVAYNLEGLKDELRLTRDLYVDIFLGKIKQWNDARITAVNPGVNLPNDDIVIVVRQDSSGTTYAFTNHLSAISTEWRDRGPGTGTLVNWPGNVMRAIGNEGVAGRIKLSKGALGYVEYGFAQRAGLAIAQLQNQAGQFIRPSGTSGLATLINTPMPDNLRVFVPDPQGTDSYPIVTYSWLLLYKSYEDQQKIAVLKQYVKWCLTSGQDFSESLGYIRLPPQVIGRATEALNSVK